VKALRNSVYRLRLRDLPILLVLCLPLAAVSDDYDDGIAAYRKGDYKTALVKLTNLARSGDSFAQNLVGQMHDNGQGTVQNYREAVRWYRMAAVAGLADAQFNLALMYQHGHGVAKDYVYSHMWLNIAAAGGSKTSGEVRGIVSRKMTSQQLDQAQQMAKLCIESGYKKCE
jgi:TPR repeat protein